MLNRCIRNSIGAAITLKETTQSPRKKNSSAGPRRVIDDRQKMIARPSQSHAQPVGGEQLDKVDIPFAQCQSLP
jgi:hypothetical protein